MRGRPLLPLVALGVLVAGACGGDAADVGDDRAAQVRAVAIEAGLPDEVADLLALAARGADASFQLSYRGDGDTTLVVSQDPPNRRVDVLAEGRVVQSQILRNGVGYLCDLPDDAEAGDPLECARRQGAVQELGTFSDEALDEFASQLAEAMDTLDLKVEPREIAGIEATCLIAGPKPGTVIDESTPGVDTLCLAPDGAQLLVDASGQRVVAESYRTTVPEGTFDL